MQNIQTMLGLARNSIRAAGVGQGRPIAALHRHAKGHPTLRPTAAFSSLTKAPVDPRETHRDRYVYRKLKLRSQADDPDNPIINTARTPHGTYPIFAEFKPAIRLLLLHPGSIGDPIRCSLVHENFFPHVLREYEALSYHWGDATDRVQIECDGGALAIPRNLHEALITLRRGKGEGEGEGKGDRILWVDGICINQADPEEREQQVQVMCWIYMLAKRVLIWLGEQREEDFQAMQMLVSVQARLGDGREGTVWKKTATIEAIKEAKSHSADGMAHLKRLLSRPYFSRMWVIQEIVNASEALVICGSQTVSWAVFAHIVLSRPDIAKLLDPEISQMARGSLYFGGSDSVRLINTCRRHIKDGRQELTFYDYLYYTRQLKVSVPRDKLFSLLSLPLRPGEVVPTPDYRSSDLDVYRSFVITDVTVNRSLKSLSWVGLGDENDEIHPVSPSWVPDWGSNGPLPLEFCAHALKKSASGSSDVHATVNERGDTLTVRGRRISTLTAAGVRRGDLYKEASVDVNTARALDDDILALESFSLCLCLNTYLPQVPRWQSPIDHRFFQSDDFSRLLRAMCLDYDWVRREPVTERTVLALRMAAWLLVVFYHEGVTAFSALHAQDRTFCDEALQLYLDVMRTPFWNRFCALEDGSVGWAPGGAASGDVVCVFNGGNVPYLLRPLAGDLVGQWTLVGECWIEGLMDGEAMENREFVEQAFLIV